MKILIVHAHPEPRSFNGALTDTARRCLAEAGHELVVSDLYTMGWDLITAAAEDTNRAIEEGAYRVGEEAGLPLLRFPLEETGAAHDAVERGAVGKVLVMVAGDGDAAWPESPPE